MISTKSQKEAVRDLAQQGDDVMKGERTIVDKPFRYGGIMHNYERDADEWASLNEHCKRCYCCGGKMGNIYSPSGTLLRKSYPYMAMFKITKGRNKGKAWLKILCRACAYEYGRGVIEKDGITYYRPNEFKE